jgi:predicted nucleic acid-binding protein
VRIYLDTCCLNRPFDDQTQPRIHLEAEAVILILGSYEKMNWEWVGSEILLSEIEEIPDHERKNRLRLLIENVKIKIILETDDLIRARQFVDWGFTSMDALHIACAERANCDYFLTTDDRLINRSVRYKAKLKVKVQNPLKWLDEVMKE